jgi:hypothetical protein
MPHCTQLALCCTAVIKKKSYLLYDRKISHAYWRSAGRIAARIIKQQPVKHALWLRRGVILSYCIYLCNAVFYINMMAHPCLYHTRTGTYSKIFSTVRARIGVLVLRLVLPPPIALQQAPSLPFNFFLIYRPPVPGIRGSAVTVACPGPPRRIIAVQ